MTTAQMKRALKGKKLSLTNVEKILKELGYAVIQFNTPLGDYEIERYYLMEEKAKLKAFTYYENSRIVFIDARLHTEDKLYLLLHELGHIHLEHLEGNNLESRNRYLMDIEADNFAYSIIYSKNNMWIYILLSIIILSVSLIVGMNHFKSNTTSSYTYADQLEVSEQYEQATNTSDMTVYVTQSGNRFHRASCYYINNKTTMELPRSSALAHYAPCTICNP